MQRILLVRPRSQLPSFSSLHSSFNRSILRTYATKPVSQYTREACRSVGIVGMPNIGKSTLFNALTSAQIAEASNYPFCTIEPNIAKLAVPDERLAQLAQVQGSKKTVSAQIEFYDIAGLVRGASKGEGLGNKFLANIREVSVIVHCVRCFEDEEITHVDKTVNPLRDIDTINTELILADLESLEKAKSKRASKPKEVAVITRTMAALENGKFASSLELNESDYEIFKSLRLLTAKPVMFVCNVKEGDTAGNSYTEKVETLAKKENTPVVIISARIEEEIALMDEETKKGMTQEDLLSLGASAEAGLPRLIKESRRLLGQQTYYTCGPIESRAWSIPVGTKAKEAAGVIHSDMSSGFIKAEVVGFDQFIEIGKEVSPGTDDAARSRGKVRIEGPAYEWLLRRVCRQTHCKKFAQDREVHTMPVVDNASREATIAIFTAGVALFGVIGAVSLWLYIWTRKSKEERDTKFYCIAIYFLSCLFCIFRGILCILYAWTNTNETLPTAHPAIDMLVNTVPETLYITILFFLSAILMAQSSALEIKKWPERSIIIAFVSSIWIIIPCLTIAINVKNLEPQRLSAIHLLCITTIYVIANVVLMPFHHRRDRILLPLKMCLGVLLLSAILHAVLRGLWTFFALPEIAGEKFLNTPYHLAYCAYYFILLEAFPIGGLLLLVPLYYMNVIKSGYTQLPQYPSAKLSCGMVTPASKEFFLCIVVPRPTLRRFCFGSLREVPYEDTPESTQVVSYVSGILNNWTVRHRAIQPPASSEVSYI
ncbi:hypothetical protein PROFUN_06000 [Planoprotostelium fungivorum]|uniref:OBG-type G domain-containing protein n=1 Tax=Planoprotostelium fungivorum TaxID=1890364 RepID=A0A2P6NPJ0_9EUKA|nr:hypothetical protein PROFUN_06000 [Planoprotostelium fungivorum]